jgi:streptogramin lyase
MTHCAAGRGLVFAEGERNLHSLALAGGYLWAGCCLGPSLLLRVDPDLGGYRRVEFGAEGGLHDLSFDGEALWVAHASGHLSRVEPESCRVESTRLEVSSGQRAFLYCSHFDGEHLWIGTYTDPGCVLRFDRHGGRTLEFAIPESPMHSTRALTSAAGRIWAALYTVPGRLAVLDPEGGGHEIVPLGEENTLPTSIDFDGEHVWVGLDTMPARLVKVDPAARGFETVELHELSSCCRGLACAGGGTWAGLYTEPAELVRVSPDGGRERVVLPAGYANSRDMVAGEGMLWTGFQNVRHRPSSVYGLPLPEDRR